MVLGDKVSEAPAAASSDRPLDWLKAIVCLALSSGLVFILISAVPAT
jgi:hypothetical protein